MKSDLAARLAKLAALQQTTTYGALARDLAIPGPGAIAKLTAALEALMDEDAAAGLPFRAVLCEGRLARGLPAQGFFDKAAALQRMTNDDPRGFVTAERNRLFAIYSER